MEINLIANIFFHSSGAKKCVLSSSFEKVKTSSKVCVCVCPHYLSALCLFAQNVIPLNMP